MRLLHLSDLHLGKQVHGYSMQEEQEAMLDRVLDLIDSRVSLPVIMIPPIGSNMEIGFFKNIRSILLRDSMVMWIDYN